MNVLNLFENEINSIIIFNLLQNHYVEIQAMKIKNPKIELEFAVGVMWHFRGGLADE